jgi:hypothetical protein
MGAPGGLLDAKDPPPAGAVTDNPRWRPTLPSRVRGTFKMADLLTFAGVVSTRQAALNDDPRVNDRPEACRAGRFLLGGLRSCDTPSTSGPV